MATNSPVEILRRPTSSPPGSASQNQTNLPREQRACPPTYLDNSVRHPSAPPNTNNPAGSMHARFNKPNRTRLAQGQDRSGRHVIIDPTTWAFIDWQFRCDNLRWHTCGKARCHGTGTVVLSIRAALARKNGPSWWNVPMRSGATGVVTRCELNRWFWSLTYETIVIMGRKLACVARAANTRERAGKSMGEKERSDVGHLHSSDSSLQEREGGDACLLLEERRYIASKRPFLATTGHHQHQRFS